MRQPNICQRNQYRVSPRKSTLQINNHSYSLRPNERFKILFRHTNTKTYTHKIRLMTSHLENVILFSLLFCYREYVVAVIVVVIIVIHCYLSWLEL